MSSIETAAIGVGVHDLSFADYFALEAWGSGSLRAMRRGPPVRVLWERESPKADTEATLLGSAVHCALLTPELFAATYAYKPEGMTFASKEGKAWREAHGGLRLLSAGAGVLVESIREALECKAAVKRSLSSASHREAALVWNCSVTGEQCKAKTDWLEGRYVYDLKVSRHASGGALAYRAFMEGWMHQLAHYRTGCIELGMDVRGGRLVVVEPTLPHFVYTLEVKTDALDLLELENIETLKLLRECRTTGVYPGTPEQWIKLDLPARALAEMGAEMNADGEESEEAF